MAAVMALVFVPALAAALLMLGTLHGGVALSTVMAIGVFLALSVGMVFGLLKLSRTWENDGERHEH